MTDGRDTTQAADDIVTRALDTDEALPATASEPEEPSLVGTNVSRYALTRRLGAGGMGVVYEATDPKLGREIAVKLLKPGRFEADIDQAHERLLREAQILAQISHPNVVPVFDVGQHERSVFIAMKLLRGQTARQWCKAATRRWDEVLRVYCDAGRGLQAAHAAGLVHRDFKPDNVIVEEDGNVVVLDFGIAAAATTLPTSISIGPSSAIDDRLSSRLTATGTVMGTPAYMSPEQALNKSVDERSDQYSFCATLYEALYGERAFSGRSPKELIAAKLAEAFAAPTHTGVPTWARRAVLRGLSSQPNKRWRSMTALIKALERRRRSPVKLAIAAGSVALMSALGWSLRAGESTRCDADALVAPIWNAEVRDALGTTVGESPPPYVVTVLEQVRTRIDGIVSDWRTVYGEVCLANADRVRDHQLACLQDRLDGLSALLTTLAAADANVLVRANDAVDALPSSAACRDPAALAQGVAPPPEGAAGEQVAWVREQVELATTQQRLGRASDALAIVEAAVEVARTLDYAPVAVEAITLLGDLQTDVGEYATARTTLAEAVVMAEAAGYDAIVARAAIILVHLDGVTFSRAEDAEHWARTAETALQRMGDDKELRARLLGHRSMVGHTAGRHAEARAQAEQALALLEELYGPTDRRVAGAVRSLAMMTDDPAASIALYRRALKIGEDALGKDHPSNIPSLNNLGRALFRQLELDEAQALHERALAITEASLGKEHPSGAYAHSMLGSIAYIRDDYATALRHHERSVALMERSVGPDDPFLANAANNIGLILRAQGRPADALPHFERACRLIEATHGPNQPKLATAQRNLADLLVELERLDEAATQYQASLRVLDAMEQPDQDQRAMGLTSLGRVYETLGRTADARATMELALTAARVAADPTDDDDSDDERLATIEAWLAEHPA